MESRVAIIGIIVENMEATERLNAICTNMRRMLSGVWEFRTGKKGQHYFGCG